MIGTLTVEKVMSLGRLLPGYRLKSEFLAHPIFYGKEELLKQVYREIVKEHIASFEEDEDE